MSLAFKRYSAVRPKTGKPSITLAPTAKILAILDVLQYGPLASTFIKTWVEPGYDYLKPVHTYTDVLLRKMDEAHLIGMPEEAKRYDVMSRPFVYEILPLGSKILLEKNLWRPTDGTDQFKHRFMRAAIRFSFMLAGRDIAGLRLLTEADVIANPKCPPATRAEKYPSHVPLDRTVIKPDGNLFGFEYTAGDNKAFMFFHGFEADRGTEQQKEASERKTIAHMLRNYGQYYRERIYATRYGLPQSFTPIVTNKPRRMQNMMAFVEAEFAPDIQSRFLFKTMPDFNDAIPAPTAFLVTEPWARIGAQPLHILDTLKVTAERNSHDTRTKNRPSAGISPAENKN